MRTSDEKLKVEDAADQLTLQSESYQRGKPKLSAALCSSRIASQCRRDTALVPSSSVLTYPGPDGLIASR